jgi:uncharacterized protein (TIGR01244 family)
MGRLAAPALATFVALLVSFVAPARAGEIPATVDAAQIPAYRVLAPGLASAGQPTPEALTRLGQLGFRTVVNLRAEKEGPAEERATVEGQGLRYVPVPLTPDSFSLDDVLAVEGVLADPAAAPVLLHCASSNRVGGVWAVIAARKGKSLEESLAAGRQAGLHSPAMEEAVRRVLAPKP